MSLLIAVHFGIGCLTPLLVRWLRGRAFFVLALAPAAAFVWLCTLGPQILAGRTVVERVAWIPALGIDLSYAVGTLQWVLALLVAGIGALVLLYCRWYFGESAPARTGGILVAFAGAMLGLVTADDLIALYVFWELTTVFSYLLVGHNPTAQANRRAAMTALIVTTFGGLAMLIGLIGLGHAAGTFSLSGLLADPPRGPLVTASVLLVLLGALTKSAQVPFHFWLPGAMAAPTPVSAYLHAAAMVKAGVYLVAVLAPAFAGTPGWRPVLLLLGAATMIVGGWRALRQYDIKVLLAYGTVSQLGFLMVLVGLGTRAGALAGLAMVVAHALFKAALFLVVGVVDHQAGGRDLRKLSGVGRQLPVTFVAAVLAGASMAAVPPLTGFVAKEGAFEAVGYLVGNADGDGTGIGPLASVLLLVALTLGSVLTVAYTLRFVWGAFATKTQATASASPAPDAEWDPTPTPVHRPARGFELAPALLALACLVGGFLGHPLTAALEPYASAFTIGEPSHGLALWHGFTVPLLVSAIAVAGGLVLFGRRTWVARVQATFPRVRESETVYQAVMRGVDRLAVEVTAVSQRGSLPLYLGAILIVLIVLPGAALVGLGAWPGRPRAWDTPAQAVVALVMIMAAFLAATSRGRLKAVILVGVTGYGVALLFALHGAPDLALTQTLVETVTVVIFALVLRKLPKYFTDRPLHSSRWWRMAVAVGVGAVVSLAAYVASGARVATPVSAAYGEAAYEFGYGKNIVNVTLVDIRAWDTMGEISVLVVAATGVASLIFLRTRYTQLRRPSSAPAPEPTAPGRITWLRAGESLSPLARSIIFEVVTRLLFPIMILVSLYLLFAGHNAPGGGFAGGLVAGLALMVRYLAAGARELDEAAPVDAGLVLGLGLLIAGLSALAPIPFGGRILQSYEAYVTFGPLSELHTPWGTVPLLGEFHLVTSLFFDIGVYLVVVGVMLDLTRSLGAGIDRHEDENATPSPKPSLRARAGVTLGRSGREVVSRGEQA
ncbi:multicomponent Na+:H+ antiporter subunit A [Friedmanniella endophytica]|uniref:Multicomponent Na+:H+ antiporter subunit A n=1 Tax=Microlunatus kandeliicorticis TaxID=1759536 RepID=A0A7W3IVF2_9ACTN|nr:Na+/H+ antiporter subunit A [Microlunatus kandeliicorticis]MBA8796001.1 multicomponent Na+:H+ antiporter subunit A [Microlunatus kandeliicorticis]